MTVHELRVALEGTVSAQVVSADAEGHEAVVRDGCGVAVGRLFCAVFPRRGNDGHRS